MATTLTKSTGTVTLSGAAEKVTLPASYGWVWVKNMSEGDIFAGLYADISEGADGVLTIPAGECGRVQMDGSREFYLLGTGNALVVAQNYADCPFKSGAKGGEIPDLSAYAKKADVPNIKVNSAVNADTVGGKEPKKIFFDNGLTSDLDSATKSGCYAASPDTLNAPLSSWWLVDTANFDNQFIVQKAHAIGNTANTVSYIRNYANNAWSDWTEIYMAGNMPYVTGSATAAANSTTCTSNHGFTPSAVIWWDSVGKGGVALSFSETQFTMDVVFSDERTVNYLIFK